MYQKSFKRYDNGPFTQKRNNYSPGIYLTTQTWLIRLLFSKLILLAQNDEYSSEKYWKLKSLLFHQVFLYYLFHFENNKKN